MRHAAVSLCLLFGVFLGIPSRTDGFQRPIIAAAFIRHIHSTQQSNLEGRQSPSHQRTIPLPSGFPTSTRLFNDLWQRLEIEEDEEPQWYLLNCIAGLELELLSQCRSKCTGMPDVVKFVVPTVTTTRSHGAKRMVQDVKVKYQGYVFAKLRLTEDTYTSIQEIDLCRSWMGTINMKGHRKLPPAPLPLNEEEVESFDLEAPKWEQVQPEVVAAAAATNDQTVILDTEEYEKEESRVLDEIEEEVKTVYKGLKVDDMVKVEAKNKFFGEEGSVRRLKDHMIRVKFFTYGTVFEEWLDPLDVRKLTEEEALKGLQGPTAPITQKDLEEPRQEREGRFGEFDRRNRVGSFGDGPRNRRQDRTERRFRGNADDEGAERNNWSWYQQNERRSRDGGYLDGEEHIRGSADQGRSRRNFWAEGDVDSQWGRGNSQRRPREPPKRNQQKRQQDDWSGFISESSPSRRREPPTEEETDDFFSSLMSDLSSDVGHTSAADLSPGNDSGNDDDFFASLMSEISNDDSKSDLSKMSDCVRDDSADDNDFFATLEQEIRGSTRQNKSTRNKNDVIHQSAEKEAQDQLDDIFAELSMDDVDVPSSSTEDEDDFFASLESELASDLDKEAPLDTDEDSFFVGLGAEFIADLNREEPSKSDFDVSVSSLEAEISSETHNAAVELTASSVRTMGPLAGVDKSESHEHGAFDAGSLKKRTIPELKELLRERGLKVSGKKADLIERLTATPSS